MPKHTYLIRVTVKSPKPTDEHDHPDVDALVRISDLLAELRSVTMVITNFTSVENDGIDTVLDRARTLLE